MRLLHAHSIDIATVRRKSGEETMGNKQTIAANIYMNGDDIIQVRKDLDQPTWEWGVNNGLSNLFQVAPFQSSQQVLQDLARTGKKVLIRPAHPGERERAEPVRGIDSSDYTRSNWPSSAPQGMPPLAWQYAG
jgi:hypothetical protein